MRRLLLRTAAGLCLAPLVGWGLAWGGELTGAPVGGQGLSPLTGVKPTTAKPAPRCGSFGTSVEFVSTPSAAARRAKKEEKLVFVLHVSGNFEDPRFT